MGSEPLRRAPEGAPSQGERANVYALVIYVPGPLGAFLDDLRRELVPDYNPRAHVSVLPPRPLPVEWGTAGSRVQSLADKAQAFEIELMRVEIFPATDVIYLEVGAGSTELRQLHSAMSAGPLAFDEPYAYQPHITLAQDIPAGEVGRLHELAVRRWREFSGSRSFRAERAVLVYNRCGDRWEDLAEYRLGGMDQSLTSPNGRLKT
jgi:hypothetical protein